MYSYIKGKIDKIGSNFVVIENNNIGYKVYVSKPFDFKTEGEYKLYLYNHIKEDECSLYGFILEEEYDLFIKLLSVKGLGPKVALPFFAVGTYGDIINAINKDDILYLKKFPKVGDKLAKQVILDLKGKVEHINSDNKGNKDDDLVLVLESLGYKYKEIKNVILNIKEEESLENKIKEALKLLSVVGE